MRWDNSKAIGNVAISEGVECGSGEGFRQAHEPQLSIMGEGYVLYLVPIVRILSFWGVSNSYFVVAILCLLVDYCIVGQDEGLGVVCRAISKFGWERGSEMEHFLR